MGNPAGVSQQDCLNFLRQQFQLGITNLNRIQTKQQNKLKAELEQLALCVFISPDSSESGSHQEDLFDHPLSLSQTPKPTSVTEVPVHDTDLTAAANGYTDVR